MADEELEMLQAQTFPLRRDDMSDGTSSFGLLPFSPDEAGVFFFPSVSPATFIFTDSYGYTWIEGEESGLPVYHSEALCCDSYRATLVSWIKVQNLNNWNLL